MNASSWLLLLQSEIEKQAYRSQDGFFNGNIWLLTLIPLLAAIIIGAKNRYKKQTIRELHPGSLAEALAEDADPILVHFYRPWSIGDQCMISQVEKLATKAHDFEVAFLDVGKYPQILGLYSSIEPPALLLFAGGERVFQCEGVVDEADVLTEVREILARRDRELAAQAE